MAADHGDGGRQQGVGGLQTYRGAHCDADDVLEDGDHTGAQPVDDQQDAALLQQGEAGAQTHGGEEGQHEGVLEGVGEVEGKSTGGVAGEGDEHKDEAANDGSRDTVLGQEVDLVFDRVTDQQKNGSHCQGHDCVGVDVEDVFHSFK